jgi:transcriptional regulator with XRE-family HTH domain
MNDLGVGRALRAIRHRLVLRQQDLADRAGLSQDSVSLIERGRIVQMTIGTIRTVFATVGADLIIGVRWRGGDLDRLLDEGHAALAGAIARRLEADGWEVRLEVTYSVYREGGSIDVLAWHEASRTLLVVEVKTELASVEETLRRHDAKVRLAGRIAAERFGWSPVTVARLLVLPETSSARRAVARHDAVFARAYPLAGWALRRWLQEPVGARSGRLFLPLTSGVRGRRGSVSRKRIRRPAAEANRA